MTPRRVLVTGGCGFIGSELVQQLLDAGARVTVVDICTYAVSERTVAQIESHPSARVERVDLREIDALRDVLEEVRPERVFHLAAESHVDQSITRPAAFVETNLLGTANLLIVLSELWRGGRLAADFRMVHVSTDEVFGSLALESTDRFTETTPYDPRSPYSASKAGSDHLVRAWYHTWGFPAIVTHSSNNYGPRQYPEKLIPVIVRALAAGDPLPIYGDGRNVRDWIHVSDHARALRLVAEGGEAGGRWCVGAGHELSNLDLVTAICRIFDQREGVAPGTHEARITFVPDRPGHDRRYGIDARALRSLGWRPEVRFEEGLARTVEWYLDHPDYWSVTAAGAREGGSDADDRADDDAGGNDDA
ncbi:MAG: dTDP-glucose 4,6-dehydratase [Longimicrobiales bacterium]|nr:dTDP-glucose 4,6-dehydratase [Longimicrobiales bacterium]